MKSLRKILSKRGERTLNQLVGCCVTQFRGASLASIGYVVCKFRWGENALSKRLGDRVRCAAREMSVRAKFRFSHMQTITIKLKVQPIHSSPQKDPNKLQPVEHGHNMERQPSIADWVNAIKNEIAARAWSGTTKE